MGTQWDPPFWIGDRLFTQADIELIRWTTDRFGGLSRTELASTICENLPWKAPNGQLRVHECLPLLEQLATAGVVELPAKQRRRTYRSPRLRAEPLPEVEIVASLRELQPVTVEPVPPQEQAVWDATMAKYHALGYQRAFGAHQRYWIRGQFANKQVILGGLLFAAAAKSVAVRDAWVGWTRLQQQRFRYRIVANSRFLVLPGVKVPHLASHALALAVRRLRGDWLRRFGYEPVLAETFVAPPWHGTSYKAANWVCLGQTTGRGRQDRQYTKAGVIRQVFVYPLVRDWRRALVEPMSPSAQEQEPPPGKGRTRKPENADRSQKLAPQGGSARMITAEQQLNEMNEERVRQRYEMLAPFLDEKQRRLLAGAEAITYGVGGLEQVAALLGMAKETVHRGIRELQNPTAIEPERVRRRGGGRKPTTASDPELRIHLEELLSPSTRGDPQSPLRWTCKSTRKLAAQLNAMKPGRAVSDHLVRDLLHEMGYSLQANRKVREGSEHPDRDAQFQYINQVVKSFQQRNQPVISVDTKKKELVGDFKNAGVEWQPKGQPEEVRVHDFPLPELGKVSPYGVYDPTRNEAWVNAAPITTPPPLW